MVAGMDTIDYRITYRLSDALALQAFVLRQHLVRRGGLLAVFMLAALVITTLMNGAPLSDSLPDLVQNAERYLALFLAGLLLICLVAFTTAALAWRRRSLPREIRCLITPQGLSMRQDGFTYDTKWADADLVTETRGAFLMRFKQLYMRLPKRGFTPDTATVFCKLAAAAPPSANRLGS
jgi:hypothetical protein